MSAHQLGDHLRYNVRCAVAPQVRTRCVGASRGNFSGNSVAMMSLQSSSLPPASVRFDLFLGEAGCLPCGFACSPSPWRWPLLGRCPLRCGSLHHVLARVFQKVLGGCSHGVNANGRRCLDGVLLPGFLLRWSRAAHARAFLGHWLAHCAGATFH